MNQELVGTVIQIKHGNGPQRNAKVLAFKTKDHALVETIDGTMMADVICGPAGSATIDSFCHVGGSGYTRDKAAKALGYKNLKLQ